MQPTLAVACLPASEWATPLSPATSIADDPVDKRANQVRASRTNQRDLRGIKHLDDTHVRFGMRNGETRVIVTLQIIDGRQRDEAIGTATQAATP